MTRSPLKTRFLSVLEPLFPRLKPVAIGIGVQKGGTTALYHYLALHPKVAPSLTKEVDFFSFSSRYRRGLGFYHSHFPRRTPGNFGKVTFDISPQYLWFAKDSADRIKRYDPGMKLIVLLRNPVARAFSAWQMYRNVLRHDPAWYSDWSQRCDPPPPGSLVKRSGSFGVDFEKDILDEINVRSRGLAIEMPILALGLYDELLSSYFALFARKQILVLCSEAMRERTVEHLQRVEEFVGLPPHSWQPGDLDPKHVGRYDVKLSGKARALLESFYCEPNAALSVRLQMEFPWG